ncbi:MAG: hypothetical protein F4X11_04700 [Acidobacteria bacterium]|nr:hypothetical protein [Acidobacteriota bacterium]
MRPPRLATWLLGRLEDASSPLVGDLYEEWQNGRSARWFWRQTMSVLGGRAARYVAEHRPLAFLGLVAIGLYWLGTHVPVPGVNTDALAPVTRHGALGLYDLFTGGNLGGGTIFALGIMPYVTALCIAYLATALGFARGRGAPGRRTMAWSVRGVALMLGVAQATGIAIWLEQQTVVPEGLPLVAEPGWSFRLTLVLSVTAITACLIWLSDEISRRGIGWGVSLLFFAGLVAGLPAAVPAILEQLRAGYIGPADLAAFGAGLLVLSSLVVLVDPARRRNAHAG